MKAYLKSEIQDLRLQNIQRIIETVAAFLTALMLSSLIPNLLLQYVYTDQAALMAGQTPFWLQTGPTLILAAAVLYFIFVVIGMMLRGQRIAALKQQLRVLSDASTSDSLASQEVELEKLEAMVDEAIRESEETSDAPTKPRRGRRKGSKNTRKQS